MIPVRSPVTRRWLLGGVLLVLGAGVWLGSQELNRPPLTVRVVDVGGFTEESTIWMRFTVPLEITNTGGRTIGIERIEVEPDFDGFNEAYNVAVPFITPPLLIEGGSATTYTAGVTLLNAIQLQAGTHDLVLRVRIETEDGDVIAEEVPAEFDQSQTAAERAIRLGTPPE